MLRNPASRAGQSVAGRRWPMEQRRGRTSRSAADVSAAGSGPWRLWRASDTEQRALASLHVWKILGVPARLGLGQPPPLDLVGWDAAEIRFDVENRRAVQHIQSPNE